MPSPLEPTEGKRQAEPAPASGNNRIVGGKYCQGLRALFEHAWFCLPIFRGKGKFAFLGFLENRVHCRDAS